MASRERLTDLSQRDALRSWWHLVPLPKGVRDHLETEKQKNKKKHAPAETRHDGGGRFLIHFGLFLIC